VLKEYDLWELVDKLVTPSIDSTTLEAHNKNNIKENRVLLDSVKDHIIPHLIEKKMAKYMFYSLVILFKRKNMNKKIVLRNKLISVHMSRYDNVASYLMRITHVCDHLTAMREKMEDTKLVNVE